MARIVSVAASTSDDDVPRDMKGASSGVAGVPSPLVGI